ncbi:hypothetical protein [Nocardioides nanhaiensis]|uniref:Uncharacterized protein n=1 Tax=Nocardioides nanhaiensis TaxID=1476871 RepID=A0ABP8W445_9ACTN
MTDQQHARTIGAWIARGAATMRELAVQHAALAAHVTPGGGGGDGTGRSATTVHQAAPVRLEVVDLRAAIAADARRYAGLARGTLRGGVDTVNTTAGRLGEIAAALPDLHATDPNLAAEVIERMWDHHRDASRVVEPPRGLRPFRIEETCPECGIAALWVDPKGWRIGCGMPSCRRVWGVHEPVLAGRR